ncbi:MAG: hypothetical protein KJO21_03025 [Verrucomicrobiae bacterium]|nr:hypothetical protein [Verrucomicrobiae bacterium]NNJ41889.1 hypothetical protein [Akkermansiaceae bacterium]
MTDEQAPKLPEPQQNTPPMPPYQPSPQATDPDYQSMKETGFSHILNDLLKKPLSVIYEVKHGNHSPLSALLIVTLASLAIFGIVLGMFSSGEQLWAAPVKIIGGVLFSGLICFPSLYIFGSLGGMDAKIQHVMGIMLTFLAITSLLLVGFAPVIWLFSTSSNSLVFFGILCLTIWIICLTFGLRIILRASKIMGGRRGGHLNIWAVIFIMVTVQMTTTLRPIIGKSDSFLNLEEKRFFIRYWFEVMESESQSGSPRAINADTGNNEPKRPRNKK